MNSSAASFLVRKVSASFALRPYFDARSVDVVFEEADLGWLDDEPARLGLGHVEQVVD